MQKSRYALLGFAAVIIIGFIVAYCGVYPQKPAEMFDQSQLTSPPVETQSSDVDKAGTDSSPEVNSSDSDAVEPLTQSTDAASSSVSTNAPDNSPSIEPETQKNADATALVAVPSFDVLRVEADGSLVIAGKAAPNATVDIISKTKIIGSAIAGDNGDFAIVIDRALSPGDYQLVLRATTQDNSVATSQQTAIVSVPDNASGKILALVEEPGKASRMITTPVATVVEDATDAGDDTAKKQDEEQSEEPITADSHATIPAVANGSGANTAGVSTVEPTDTGKTSRKVDLAVEAVELEGNSIFVAGKASDGSRVNIYANTTLLGTAIVTPEHRFLLQTHQVLAVGDYIIKADLLDAAGDIIATARVPFHREAGENIAAVAPSGKDSQTLSSGNVNGQGDEAANAGANDKLHPVEGSVIIRKGDNLWTISKRTYGSGIKYTTIYLANSDQIKNPDLIWPGQVFTMPKDPLSTEDVERRLHEN